MSDKHPLRLWRDEQGLTLEALAAKLGIFPSTISQIETGKRSPSLGLAQRLVEATGGAVQLTDFVRERAAS